MGVFSFLKQQPRAIRRSDGSWEVQNIESSLSDNTDYLQLALRSPVLSTCIDIRARYRSKVKYKELDNNGKEIENSEIVEILNNPNPLQTKKQFIMQEEWFRLCYGYLFQKAYTDSLDMPYVVYNLNPLKITFDTISNSIFKKKSEIVNFTKTKFQYKDINNYKTFSYNEVMTFYDIANGLKTNNPFISPSRIESIHKQLENLDQAAIAENKAIQSCGREMIYKEKTKDAFAAINPQDKNNAERIFNNNYGLGSGKTRTLVTDVEMGHKSMHLKHDELGMTEILENNSSLVCQRLEIPNEIYKFYKTGDTFTNKYTSEIQFIQNVIAPLEEDKVKAYSKQFNKNIVADFSHLPCFQEVENTKADRLLKLATAIKNLVTSGFSKEEAEDFIKNNNIDEKQ